MNYLSLHKEAPAVSFQEAVINGLAPDKGLYFPETITPLSAHFFETLDKTDNVSIALEAIQQFVGDEITTEALRSILEDVLSFPFPIVEIDQNLCSLELYHGPTMAFKDVGARFMARCLGYFNQQSEQKKVTVLVATSGDTGGAVAHGFYEVEGVEVVILYPSGKVSNVQEKQLTTLGKNITALEVDGTFDDCQRMVKRAFLDKELTQQMKLTSANSINVARWLPQMFYYFFAYKQLKATGKQLVFSVPSGNYGNICAGMMAQKLGLPIAHFVTGTNQNNVVPNYLKTGHYQTKKSVQTISNAMDVGDPSNFIRIRELYGDNFEALKANLSGYSYSDEQTTKAIHELYEKYDYIADPHGAIGYLALKDYLKDYPENSGVFLETAHPIKFLPVMPEKISKQIEVPEQISALLQQEKRSHKIATYEELKTFMLSS